ncbi:MAG: glycosyltransferase [Bacillota bacterium]|nr:glycosyltransferase [Bacillota bacterium]
MKFSVLIPVYNSENSLGSLVGEIESYFKSSCDSCEIVMVDDCSTDDSWMRIEELCHDHPQIKGIRMDRNRGQQMALYWGLKYCEGEFAVTIDDDLQHDIADLDLLLERAKSGADLVFGIYDAYGSNGVRAKGSELVGMFFRINYPNLNGNRVSSYRLIHRSVYKSLIQRDASFVYLSAELLAFAKTVENVKVKRRDRKFGRSGYTLKKCVEITLKLNFYYGMPFMKRLRKVNVNETCVDGWCGKLSNQWD